MQVYIGILENARERKRETPFKLPLRIVTDNDRMGLQAFEWFIACVRHEQ